MRKFYLYAGYYELFISNRPLRRPYSFISWHKSLDAAQRAAEKFDPDAHVHYAEQIAPPETDDPEIIRKSATDIWMNELGCEYQPDELIGMEFCEK